MLNRHIAHSWIKWARVGISSLYLVHVYECRYRWGEMIYGLDDSKRWGLLSIHLPVVALSSDLQRL
jgi:hypothetical protein